MLKKQQYKKKFSAPYKQYPAHAERQQKGQFLIGLKIKKM
jgi:hypothetical protein